MFKNRKYPPYFNNNIHLLLARDKFFMLGGGRDVVASRELQQPKAQAASWKVRTVEVDRWDFGPWQWGNDSRCCSKSGRKHLIAYPCLPKAKGMCSRSRLLSSKKRQLALLARNKKSNLFHITKSPFFLARIAGKRSSTLCRRILCCSESTTCLPHASKQLPSMVRTRKLVL